MSSENLEKISPPELNISKDNLVSGRSKDNEQTDRHTRILKLFGTNVETSQECLWKI